MEFVVSTEDLNRDGYRTLTSGIKLDNFLKNPVMYFNHDWGKVPIGSWKDVKKVDDKLIATPVFNEKDAFALQIKNAVENGTINATSIGADPITFSSDPQYLVSGQWAETLVECDLLEISFAGIPMNPNAVRLSANKKEFEVPKLKQKPIIKMKKIALSLGLKETATETEIITAIQAQKTDVDVDQKIEVLLALGKTNGHVTEDNIEKYRKLAKSDYQTTFELIGISKKQEVAPADENTPNTEPPITLSAIMKEVKKGNGSENPQAESLSDKFLRLSKTNPTELAKIEKEDPKHFAELNEAYVKSK